MKIMNKRKILTKIGIFRTYFMRGYSVYFAFPIGLVSTSLIVYNFLIVKIPFLLKIFSHYWLFFLIYSITLIPLSILIGKIDYKKGIYRHEQDEIVKHSPQWSKLFKKLDDMEFKK